MNDLNPEKVQGFNLSDVTKVGQIVDGGLPAMDPRQKTGILEFL